jgi:hyperosmotically inducible periplasmic protein
MKETMAGLCAGILFAGLCAIPAAAQTGKGANREAGGNVTMPGAMGAGSISREVRHQLVMLPYYTVFDNLAYRVDGSTVTLYGQVVRPQLKSDAAGVVKSVEGVERVVNQIQVLPLSPMDDQIRRAEFRAIYGFSDLYRYAEQAIPSIHIIVDNGKVTLVGVVDSTADKNLAGLRANTVPGVFSVTNDLQVQSR